MPCDIPGFFVSIPPAILFSPDWKKEFSLVRLFLNGVASEQVVNQSAAFEKDSKRKHVTQAGTSFIRIMP